MPQPPDRDPPRRHGLGIRETAEALADAVNDPVLQTLLRARPFVAVILLSHKGDHVQITPSGVSVTYGQPGAEGSIHITSETLATLQDTHRPDGDVSPNRSGRP